MTREEAIKEAYGIPVNKKQHEALQILIPELKENGDERIRMALCDIVRDMPYMETELRAHGLTVEKTIAYLENQKDASYAIEAVDRIDKYIDEHLANAHDMKNSNPDKKYYRGWDDALGKMAGILQDVYSNEKQKEQMKETVQKGLDVTDFCEPIHPDIAKVLPDVINELTWGDEAKQKEQKPIKMEVYEIGKGTTICGQDYKCKKDYMTGTCRYIKDVIYHCSRDGYLNDQNGVSWSCTPEWFNEYIQSNAEWAEEEKTRFVSGQFLQCKLSFDGFKEGEHYWLEYIGDDMYVGRSDNILNQKFHITPRQLYTLFSQQLEEVQGPSREEKQVSLNYEPPFNENPSDKEIIEALIHHLNEQDGFLTAINYVSTKAILSWLKKQKEQKTIEYVIKSITKNKEAATKFLKSAGIMDDKGDLAEMYRSEQKPAEWDKLQEDFRNINEAFEDGKKEVVDNPERYGLCRPAERSKEDERIRIALCDIVRDVPYMETELRAHGLTVEKTLSYLEKRKEEKPSIFPPGFGEVRWNPVSSVQRKSIFRTGDTIMAKACIPDEYVKKFKALCDGYEIKLPNREHDIYHLCDDLAELFGNTNKQE